MKNYIWGAVSFTVLLVVGFFILNWFIYEEKQAEPDSDADKLEITYPGLMKASYVIEGERVQLQDGAATIEVSPGSVARIETRYFGNEIRADLNGDGREDMAFIITQNRGGSGTFFYAVAALNTPEGFVGSDGYLLGDRIAPQSTNISTNPRHVNVVVFNYADRAPGEPMTTEPSVGKSVYLKIDPASMQWGIVEPDFEGESR